MAVNYASVLWNGYKKKYDLWMTFGILLLLLSFIVLQIIFRPNISIETLIIRSTSLTAFFLLHFILIIGPLCRLNPKFLPLLYNRRHLGVAMFIIAAVHSVFGIIQFHSLGDIHPLLSIFKSNLKYREISQFPFQTLGFFAFIIFFIMAATSHDFWLKNLGPKLWKSLHMLVYVAYALIIIHVATGILQYENKPVYWGMLMAGFLTIVGIHITAGIKQYKKDKPLEIVNSADGFQFACNVEDISEKCASIVNIGGQEIAIFRYDGKVSAVHNVCKHQMGPLGEGKIIDGCITCPWHGYQYLPENGQSPPPFHEKVATYKLKIVDNNVWVNPQPLEEGTYVEPVKY